MDGRRGLLEHLGSVLPDSRVRDRIVAFRDISEESALREFGSNGVSGFAGDSVPVALLIAERHATNFREAIKRAVDLGGDTDTVASMTGQVVGAFAGENAVRAAMLFGREVDPEVFAAIEAYASCVPGRGSWDD